MHKPLETELRRGLGSVAAPPELWDRITSQQGARSNLGNRRLAWALAAVVVLAAVALSLVRPAEEASALKILAGDSQPLAFRCQNPAQLRAWVRANAGLDVPLRPEPTPTIQLIGARGVQGRAEIAYKAGIRDGVLIVSTADPYEANGPHGRASGKVFSWVMAGNRFTLACSDPAALQLACKLCHLD